MKRTLSLITMVCATTAFTAFAQDPSPTPASSPAPKHEKGKHGPGGPDGPLREALEGLTPAEREQLKAARQKAESDPAVVAAKQSGDKKAAHDAMHAAMLKADPTLGPILEKVDAAMKAGKAGKPHHHAKDKGESETH